MKRILVYGLSNQYGGIETFFINVISHADKTLCFDVVTPGDAPCSYEDIIVKNNGKRFGVTSWGANQTQHNQEVGEILTSQNYDYVWVNTASASNISIYKTVKKYSHAKIIIHSHGAAFETKNTGIKRLILKSLHQLNKNKINSYANIRFASSNQAAKWLFGKTVSEDSSIKIIKNGIAVEKYMYNPSTRENLRDEFDLKNKFVVGHVGRFAEVKNHAFLIDIFAEVVKRKKESVLLLIGNGRLESEIKEKVSTLGLKDKVIFLGYISDIENYLQAMDIFVLPSINEGLSIATIEAQAAGLKSIISDAVPEEVSVTDLVHFYSLEKSASSWADVVLSESQYYERKNRSHEIKQAHFDIESTVNSIANILN